MKCYNERFTVIQRRDRETEGDLDSSREETNRQAGKAQVQGTACAKPRKFDGTWHPQETA